LIALSLAKKARERDRERRQLPGKTMSARVNSSSSQMLLMSSDSPVGSKRESFDGSLVVVLRRSASSILFASRGEQKEDQRKSTSTRRKQDGKEMTHNSLSSLLDTKKLSIGDLVLCLGSLRIRKKITHLREEEEKEKDEGTRRLVD